MSDTDSLMQDVDEDAESNNDVEMSEIANDEEDSSSSSWNPDSSNEEATCSIEPDVPIYLDLTNATAVLCYEPQADTDVAQDAAFKTQLHKFLGLVPPVRKLFNPMDYVPQNGNTAEEQRAVSTVPVLNETLNVMQSPTISKVFQNRLSKTLTTASPQERVTKIWDDLLITEKVQHMELQTPQHLKELDLAGLPTVNCRQQYSMCLEQHPSVYSFIESLNNETPLSMCHPSALRYRERHFEGCKYDLANKLFKMFNHKIFQSALKQAILWKPMKTEFGYCQHNVGFGQERSSKIILSHKINCASWLVKVLLHEMCHAAAFVFHGETGHGDYCRKWAYKSVCRMPELQQIDECTPNFVYTCCLCQARSYGNTGFNNVAARLRCKYCSFELVVDIFELKCKKVSLASMQPNAYQRFIKEHYMGAPQKTHTSKMLALNKEFLSSLLPG